MISEAISASFYNGLARAIPEAALTVSGWAASRRVVSSERVADPTLAGYWKNDKTPYLVEVMDSVCDPRINEAVFVKSAQVGGTEAINNIIGYFMDVDPATILYVCENEGKARAWSIECFAPMLRDTPTLSALMGEAKQRDSNNMIESKGFPDGHFALAWATSPSTLSSRPRRVILTDETDAFEATKEGDPVALAEARTKTAGAQRKIVHVSTPRNAEGPEFEFSRIEKMFNDSTAEKFFVPCPHCDEFQVLTWRDAEGVRNIQWEKDAPETAYYVCKSCGAEIENSDKPEMLARGRWRSTNPAYAGNRRGFWICEIYSPFTTWGEMAQAYLAAKDDPAALKTFVNTRLAESWKPADEKIDYADIEFATEEYAAEVPDGVLVLTAGVDTQDDRLEVEIVGWGDDLESWSVDYKVLMGDPGGAEVWEDLREFLTMERENAAGEVFKIKAVSIDSGGHHPQAVYRFCKQNAGRKYFAIKGASTAGRPISGKPSRTNSMGVKLYLLGTEAAKDLIFSHLKTKEEGPGFCHFPDNRLAEIPNYFQMLRAEKKFPVKSNRKTVYVWQKVSASARNEALDCRVYALAALHILSPAWDMLKRKSKIRSRKITREENNLETETEEEMESSQNTEAESKPAKIQRRKVSRRRSGGGFASNW